MKQLALVLGVLFLLVGIAGFVPGLAANGMLFGFLPVNMAHSLAYIVAGVVGLMIGLSHRRDVVPPRGPHHDLRDFGT